jgi:uncharacterized hydrophobic protein (TIGR00271 family)
MNQQTIASINPLRLWWRDHVVATVDHVSVVEKVREEAGWTPRYVFMTLMSAGIALLGLLLSSPAVVIGAMLISPLMGPIIGLGFAIATFDTAEVRRTVVALALGVILAVLFCAAVVLMSPLQNVTEEIAARTRPNLFDLMVALFSALAGAYAMIRGREGTVVGVAIATALMPPLAVVGFGLATLNGTVFFGALLLFFTNLMTIALAAAVMARLYGFGPRLSPRQTMLQTLAMLAAFMALAVPLGLTLSQIAWEARTSRVARDVISGHFGNQARLSQIDIDYDATPLKINAEMLTPTYLRDAERETEATLSRLLDRDVDVALRQFQVGTGSGAAEAAELASAQATERVATAQREIRRVTEQLAIVAGVEPDAVLIDRDRRRAVVRATPLPGARLSAYRILEARIAALDPDWTIQLQPPAADLPNVTFGDDGPDEAGRQALATAAWGASRLNLPIGVAGSAAQTAQAIEALEKVGVKSEAIDGPGAPGGVRLVWLVPTVPDAG